MKQENKTLVHYSRLLGKCDDYLAVYKRQHKLSGLSAEEVYLSIIERIKRQNDLMLKLQIICYELEEQKLKMRFSEYLVRKKAVKFDVYAMFILNRSFLTRRQLVGIRPIERMERIVSLYDEFIKDN